MRIYFLIIIAVVAVMSCSPKFIVQTETPSNGNFSNYKTYKFYNPANLPPSNFAFSDEDKKTIFDAAAEEMKSRGYKSQQDADLLVKIQGGTSSTSEIRNDNNGYPYDYNYYSNRYYDSYRYPDRFNQQQDESKKETTIMIDIIDTQTDKVVWHGVGVGKASKKESFSGPILTDAIANIFLQYPHRAGEK